ncbi:O-unit flippase-like protein [Rariglobus hedericola]|uniref:Oligosaccharide flippase family protein n=1 Tax=Rariglobus hedericola TaxID=2597822 RepID=A0A556QQN6_9BACT|nr:O-unit flippase-like protein [Rariglobus hedericola]TSJ78958.1 hypothetical protein FPL22_06550 [Rariglobus hedericola]
MKRSVGELFKKLWASPTGLIFIAHGLRMAGGVLVLPLALRLIPKQEMGLYYTFLAVSGLVNLLDFGFAPAVSRNAGYAMGGAEKLTSHGIPPLGIGGVNLNLLGELTTSVEIYYRWASAVLAILLFSGGSYYIYTRIVAESLSESLMGAWLLFSCGQAGLFYASSWSNLLIGSGQLRAFAIITIWSQLLSVFTLCVLLGLKSSIWAYGISGVFTSCINLWLYRRFFLKLVNPRLPQKNFSKAFNGVKTLWPMAWRQGVVMLGAFMIQRTTTLICSLKVGLDETAEYGLTVYLITVIFQIASIPVSIVMPEIVRLRIVGDRHKIWTLFLPRLYLGLFVGLILVLILAFGGNLILEVISAKTGTVAQSLVLLLGAIWLLEMHHSQYANLILTENQNPFILPSLISGVAIVALAWFGAERWGVLGLILAQGLVQLLWNNWWTVYRAVKGVR